MGLRTLVGVRIREGRRAKGWNQHQLADKVGVSQSTLAEYETGKTNIPLDTLERVSEVLGMPIAFFTVADYQYTVKAAVPESLKKARTARQGKKQAAPS